MEIPIIDFDHDKAQHAGFEIIDLTTLFLSQSELSHPLDLPHRVDFYNLIYIEHADGSHLIDFQTHPYEDNSFIWVHKGQVHAFDFLSEPKGKLLIFTDAFLERLGDHVRLPIQALSHPNSQVVVHGESSQKAMVHELILELARPNANALIIQLLFATLHLMLQRDRSETTLSGLSKAQNSLWLRFNAMLQTHFSQTRDAHWYAQQLSTNYKTLNAMCKSVYQQTAKQVIDGFVILEAKRRLVLDQTHTQPLAYALGFEDDSNFVKFFKKRTQMTPSQFKKQHRSN